VDEPSSGSETGSEALSSLRTYLSDSIPPLIFVANAEDLFMLPLQTTAAEILGWVATQSHIGDAVTTSDYLFHAVKKIHLLAELELISYERINAFINGLKPFLLQSCPEHERASLASSLDNIEHSTGDVSAPVAVVHRAGGAQQVAAAGAPGVAAGGAVLSDRRVGLLLHHLQGQLKGQAAAVPTGAAAAVGPAAGPNPLVAGIVAEAAALAQNSAELESSLGQLQSYGVPVVEEGIVRMLGRSLPDWAAPAPDDSAAALPQGAVRAMKRIIGMAGDRQEEYKRFGELVTTAVDEFNQGSLGRAVTMLDLAGRMIDEEEVDLSIVDTVRNKAFAALDDKQLRSCAESEDQQFLLRRVMDFFPQLSPDELFLDLETEESRDRRRLILQLLTARGESAREAALDALQAEVKGERSFPWFLDRNLVYLLRTIDRPDEAPVEPEIDVLVHQSELDNPLPLIRESLATLGQLQHDRVVQTLVARVSELEDALVGSREIPHNAEEVQSLLDTALTMLVRTGLPEGFRCLAAHGLKRQPELGNTHARLAKLGSHDLSADATVVKRLVQALREELPTKVLGVSVGGRRKAENAERLIEALSGTDVPLVRETFKEIGAKYQGQPFANAAVRAVEKMGAPPPTEETSTAALAGDLGLFGLPSLLQNLSDSQVTGVLTVLDGSGNTAATMRLDSGLIQSARSGQLLGEPAVYQMLERPITGRFVFVDSDDESAINMDKGAPKQIQPLLFEGIRRYDEFMRAAALAPDDARFRATDRKPTKAPEEPNADLLKSVWYKAADGASPVECEAEFPVDSYRIRRLYEYWISEGSLALQSEKTPPSAEPQGP
jgi:hypothetical protein